MELDLNKENQNFACSLKYCTVFKSEEEVLLTPSLIYEIIDSREEEGIQVVILKTMTYFQFQKVKDLE